MCVCVGGGGGGLVEGATFTTVINKLASFR